MCIRDRAYTACPLCVPARMAMLSGMRAARTGIFTNVDTLPDTLPTFLYLSLIHIFTAVTPPGSAIAGRRATPGWPI